MNPILKITGLIAGGFVVVLLAFWLMQSLTVMVIPTAVALGGAIFMHRARIGGWGSLILLCLALPIGAVSGLEIRMAATPSAEYGGLFEGGVALALVVVVVALLIPLAASLFMLAALRGLRASAE
jgi:hypothetical protein